jgi:hypothetical protein
VTTRVASSGDGGASQWAGSRVISEAVAESGNGGGRSATISARAAGSWAGSLSGDGWGSGGGGGGGAPEPGADEQGDPCAGAADDPGVGEFAGDGDAPCRKRQGEEDKVGPDGGETGGDTFSEAAVEHGDVGGAVEQQPGVVAEEEQAGESSGPPGDGAAWRADEGEGGGEREKEREQGGEGGERGWGAPGEHAGRSGEDSRVEEGEAGEGPARDRARGWLDHRVREYHRPGEGP